MQWWDWLTHFVRGDLGTSTRTRRSGVVDDRHALVADAAAAVLGARIVSVVVALVLGVYSAVKQYSVGDYVFTGLSYLGIAMPDVLVRAARHRRCS